MKKLVSWIEIPSNNLRRAVKFYEGTFKINIKIQHSADEKLACFENEEVAIINSPGFKASKNGVIVSFLTPDNIEKAIARSIVLGGKVLQNKTEIQRKEGGFFALITDSEGNRIGLYSSD